jgi:thioester reductase-like protein
MENHYFFTGFPGFICNQLIREVLKHSQGDGNVYVLVQPHMVERAQAEIRAIQNDLSLPASQFEIIEGDITLPMLGIDRKRNRFLHEHLTHVFHLAAIYDLAVKKEIAFKVNVTGTDNVNNWVKQIKNLKRYTYFSTAYVAGKREGIIYENELVKPPEFKNFYEETKFEAELLVDSLKGEIPVTIIRPGIVKGHSKTGETIKFDGPYFILNFLDRLRFLPFMPRLGKSDSVVNLVPIDYIIEATTYLTFYDNGIGKTYHLTDPNPYKVSELYEMLMKELLNKKPVGTIPLSLAKFSLSFKPLRQYLGVEKEALDYFTWNGFFDCSTAQSDLRGSGIQCPDFKEGLSSMVDFYVKNKRNPIYQVQIR